MKQLTVVRLEVTVHDPFGVKVHEAARYFCGIKLHHVLRKSIQAVKMEAKVTAKHQIEHHKEILVILERKAKIAGNGTGPFS
ncbi:hypothetical protein HK405_013993, partial [Cladochytrium tenue]